jgi:transcriptional regulator NrdR family protein
MVCIYCGSKTRTVNSRAKQKTGAVWRRRQCNTCEAVFTTQESVDWSKAIVIIRLNGLEPFSRDKLRDSIHDSLKHRNDALEASTALTDTIIARAVPHISNAQLSRDTLVKTILDVLQAFDRSAAVTYRAYHPIPQ